MTTTTRVPASRFIQGGRTAYVCAPTVADLLAIIPERANPDVIQDANRRLYIPHAKNIGDYLLEREDWILGPIMAGVPADALEYQERIHMATFDVELMIEHAKVFDGQHKRFGIGYAVRRCQEELSNMEARLEATDDPDALREEIQAREQWLDALLSETVPVILYEEDNLASLQQMFADISKVRSPGAETRTMFDRSDPFNVAAMELAHTHSLLKDRVEFERATLSRQSNAVCTLAQLASVIRTLFMGINARVDGAQVTARDAFERAEAFFNDLASAQEEVRAVEKGTASPAEMRERGNLALNITIIRIEAAVWRELHIVQEQPTRKVVKFLGTLPTEPATDSMWVEAGILPARAEKATPMGRAQEARKAVALAVEDYQQSAA